MPRRLIITYAMLPHGGSGAPPPPPLPPQADEEEDSNDEEFYAGLPTDAEAEETTAEQRAILA
jgi:hypothetical protein